MISCCMIVRDDASTLRACLESVRPHVDELVIVDTGSTDGSVAIEQEFADIWELYLGCNDPENGLILDFADARNRSFDLAHGDWVLWVDGDDVLVGGENLRKLCDEAPREDNIFYLAPYEFQYNADDGLVDVLIKRERLMRPRPAFIWQTPVHEGCLPRQPMAGGLVSVETDAFKLCHHHLNNGDPREPGRNLRILKRWIERCGEGDVRALYYLGLEYGIAGDAGNALHWLKRYTELSGWTDERCLAQLEIARIYRSIGDQDQSMKWAFQAMATKSWPDPYYSIAKSCYQLACNNIEPHYNYTRCAHFAQMGLGLARSGPPKTVLNSNPRERYAIHEYLNVALSRVGQIREALASCEAGLEGMPKNSDLLNNRRAYQVELARQHIRESADLLVKSEALRPEGAVIIKATLANEFSIQLTEAPPEAVRKPGGCTGLMMPSGPVEPEPQRKGDGCLDIVIYTGPALERWNPWTWSGKGMGGSETMAWHMARLLRARGHRVRVYADCTPTMQGVFQGVEWFDHSRFYDLSCDVLIVSRDPRAVDAERKVRAGCRILWVHDVHCSEVLTHKRDAKFDRILCLSEWHRKIFLSVYPLIDESRVFVTRNGIDLELFKQTENIPTYTEAECRHALDQMIGKTMSSVTRPVDELLFESTSGHSWWFHDGERGSGNDVSVIIEDLCGDLEDLVSSPIVEASETSEEGGPGEEGTGTWTFYRFSTVKGTVTVRWKGESNGFYGEAPNLAFSGPIPRNPHKAVYSSSPDRGLQTALDCWKDVRKAVPDAELHVYYGFENWEKAVEMFGDANQMQTVRYLKQLALATPGVVVHGRISQRELAREFLSAGVWAYPTWWTETSCITAMEAQAAGLYMVTSPIAALNETVGSRGVLIEGDWADDPNYWRDPKFMKDWTEAVVRAMPKVAECEHGTVTLGGGHPGQREALQRYAREQFGIEALADEWDKMLRELHAEVTKRVVPPFTEIPARAP